MIYQVTDKKTKESHRVELQEVSEGVYRLTLDGRTVEMDVAKSGRTIYSVIEEGRQFEAVVDEQGAHGFDILIRGRLFHLEAVDERSLLLSQQAKATASGPQAVEAEMPGKVVKVHFSVGDEVEEGAGVVVLEAMKMENEIFAPVSGRITELPVREGDTVETGALLFVVSPPEEGSE